MCKILILVLAFSITHEAVVSLSDLPILNVRSASWKRENASLLLDSKISLDDEGYSYAICTETSREPLRMECKVFLWTFKNSEYQQCSLQLRGGSNTDNTEDLRVISLKQLNNERVVLRWQHTRNNVIQDEIISTVNMDDCKNSTLLFPSDADSKDSFIDSIVFHKDSTFDILVSGKDRCPQSETCKFSYTYEGEQSGKIQLLDIQLNDIVIDQVSENFVIRGYDPIIDKYKIFLMTPDGALKHMLIVEPSSEIVSWSNANYYLVCRTTMHTRRSTEIECEKFNKDGDLIMDNILKFPEAVKLIGTRDTSLAEIVVITGKSKCLGIECQEITLTKAHISGSKETTKRKVDCSGDDKKASLVFDVATYGDTAKVSYVCESKDADDITKSHLNMREFLWKLKFYVLK